MKKQKKFKAKGSNHAKKSAAGYPKGKSSSGSGAKKLSKVHAGKKPNNK